MTKAAVYTAISSIAQNATGLATIMRHEVAHAVARHGDERMCQVLLTQLSGVTLSVALSQNPSQTNNLFMAAYGMGTQVEVLLPYRLLQ